MARGRFVSKVISLDERVNGLSNDTCRLLFTWLITHLDCEGRMHGDACTVRSVVFPRRNDSTKKIENYLVELEKNGLILRYSIDGNQYLCMKTFEKHQPGLNKKKESPSQIPPVPPDLLQSNSGISPTQVKVKVKVKEKENNKRKYGEFENVLLTDEELQKLKGRFGDGKTKNLIENLSSYKKSKGRRYKSDYATILNWSRRNGEQKGETKHIVGRGVSLSSEEEIARSIKDAGQ